MVWHPELHRRSSDAYASPASVKVCRSVSLNILSCYFLVRASLHYHRIHPAYWKDRMLRVKAPGPEYHLGVDGCDAFLLSAWHALLPLLNVSMLPMDRCMCHGACMSHFQGSTIGRGLQIWRPMFGLRRA